MLTSGIPELSSSEDVQYVRDALLPGVTDIEATIAFTRSESAQHTNVVMVTCVYHTGVLKPVWGLKLLKLISLFTI